MSDALKPAAKRLAAHLKRTHAIELNHGQALNAIAAAVGVKDWASLMSGASWAGDVTPLKANQAPAPTEQVEKPKQFYDLSTINASISPRARGQQQVIFEMGPTASGKTIHTIRRAVEHLNSGSRVTIIDAGRSYQNLAEETGGTVVVLHHNGSHQVNRYGAAALLIYETEELLPPSNTASVITAMPPERWLPASEIPHLDLLIVDEVDIVQQVFPAIVRVVAEFHRHGGTVWLRANTRKHLADFEGLSGQRSVIQREYVREAATDEDNRFRLN